MTSKALENGITIFRNKSYFVDAIQMNQMKICQLIEI